MFKANDFYYIERKRGMEVDYMMDELKKIFQMEPLREKILIVDSYYIGNQIVEAFMNQEHLVVNLHVKTVSDLAVELLSSQKKYQEKRAERAITEHFIYRILTEMKSKGELYYFNNIEISSSFCQSMHESMMQLRLAGYDEYNLQDSHFLSKEKGNDFKNILAQYARLLKENHLADSAAILKQALQLVTENNQSLFILQPNLQLNYLQHQFLQKLLPEKKYKLSLAKVYGVNLPENSSFETIKWGPSTPLSYIYCPNEYSEPMEEISVHIAKTIELEVKVVLQSLKRNQAPLDQAVLYYTSSESYLPAIYQISQKLNIPITFSQGLPVMYSSPGKLIAGLMKWMQANFHIQVFLPLLQEGLISFKGSAAPAHQRVIKLLRDLQIGWGKDRYIPIIDQSIEALEKQLTEDKNIDLADRLENLSYLKIWLQEIFDALPSNEGKISYKSLLKGIHSILCNCSAIDTDLDFAANKEMKQKIEAVLPFLNEEEITIYDAVQRASDLLLTGRINASDPKPGFLHTASYEDGIYNRRKFVYFMGLDNQRFPGKSMENPLLLDSERASLKRRIPILQEQPEKKLYSILQALAQCRRIVTASYCNFDVANNRTVNPSYLFLQLYRAASGNSQVDFKEINAVPTQIFSEEALEAYDVWAEKLAGGEIYHAKSGLLDLFPNIENGLIAEQMRQSELFTVYDGKVKMDEAVSNYLCKNKTLSASKLEMLATCPYAYFLSEVLKLKVIDETDFDENKWLDAKTRGILLHKIFELFLKQLKKLGEKPDYKKHQRLLSEMAMQIINEEKRITAPPSERVFQLETADVLHCCDIFLKEEEVFCKTYEPYEFEYTFGMNGIEPAVLTLADGEKVFVSGKSDRVDRDQSEKMHIIDYKTGSTYGYDEQKAFNGGRQMQHLIYALAIEQHMNLEAGTVVESSYYFPSAKGNGERIVRKQTDDVRKAGIHILTELINMIKSGGFTMTNHLDDCRYCNFKSVCRRASYQTELFNKKLDDEYRGLASFKEVRGYD
mgnify:CR=1 FL=1